MAKDETKRLKPSILSDDSDVNDAIQSFTDYDPSDDDYTKQKLTDAKKAMTDAQAEETRLQGLADGARDNACSKEWAFHNTILAAKKQVVAQYGENSDEVQSVGLKKKSERAAPKRKPKPTP